MANKKIEIFDPDTFNWKKQSEKFWQERLTPEEFLVLRKKGTERLFSGKYCELKEEGIYHCAGCNFQLFSYSAKYDSRSGWPSFWEPIDISRLKLIEENSTMLGTRIEVLCARCESHLGHVFDDGPPPTYKRYCLNSVSLKFENL